MAQDPRFIPDTILDPRFTPDTTDERFIPDIPIQEEPEESDGFLQSILGTAFTTPEFVSKGYEAFRKIPQPIRAGLTGPIGGTELGLNIAESLSTPGDIALMLGTGGPGLIPRIGRGLQKVAGGLLTAKGGERLATAESPIDVGAGLLETAGGIFGVKSASKAGRIAEQKATELITESELSKLPAWIQEPTRKLKLGLKESKPLIKEQKEIYTKERAEKFAKAGEVDVVDPETAGQFLGKLAGEHTKIIREPLKLDHQEITSLYKFIGEQVSDVPTKAHAITGLRKMLEGSVPQLNEIKTLERIFGTNLEHALQPRGKLAETYDLARGLLSVDLPFITSAGFRQGLPLITTRNWYKAWIPSVKVYGSEMAGKAHMDNIRARELFKTRADPKTGQLVRDSFAVEAGLKFTDLRTITTREDALRSQLAERIPGIGKIVRASNRSYTAFLNDLRANTFESLIKDAQRIYESSKATGRSKGFFGKDLSAEEIEKLNPLTNKMLAEEIAEFVNTATGRGSLKTKIPFGRGREISLEKHAELLSQTLFSPRLLASRINMLNPATYTMANPFVRKQYLKAALSTATAWSTFASLAKFGGADVSLDTNSADFGKIRIGDTRIDPAGGFQQLLVLYSRLARGETTSSISGRESILGQGFGAFTGKDIIESFGTNKLHPVLKFAYDLANASEYRPFHLADRVLQMYVPMITQDMSEIIQESPELLFLLPLISAGMGTQTYSAGPREGLFIPPEMDITFERSPAPLSFLND